MDVDDRQRHQTLWTCYRSLDLGLLPFLPFLEILNEKERKRKEKMKNGFSKSFAFDREREIAEEGRNRRR